MSLLDTDIPQSGLQPTLIPQNTSSVRDNVGLIKSSTDDVSSSEPVNGSNEPASRDSLADIEKRSNATDHSQQDAEYEGVLRLASHERERWWREQAGICDAKQTTSPRRLYQMKQPNITATKGWPIQLAQKLYLLTHPGPSPQIYHIQNGGYDFNAACTPRVICTLPNTIIRRKRVRTASKQWLENCQHNSWEKSIYTGSGPSSWT